MSSIAPPRNLLGIPIEGVITGMGDRKTRQRPVEELRPYLQAVLHEPGIHSFGWRQYTPYYNDGEPCVFGVGNIWFLTPEAVEDPEDKKLREDDYYRWEEVHSYGGFGETVKDQVYDEPKRRYVDVERQNPHHNQRLFEVCERLSAEVWSGEFHVALLAAFGDHAIVTVNKDKITVEYFEHDDD